jgi:PBP1b-binding outer membrane lipoprotein LpoB
MQKKFAIGFIVLLGISLFLLGCSDDSSNYDSTTPTTACATELVKSLDIADTFATTASPAIVVPQPILRHKLVFPAHS